MSISHVSHNHVTHVTPYLFYFINLLLRCQTYMHMCKLPIHVGIIMIILDYHIL